jgi:hypothetical protein
MRSAFQPWEIEFIRKYYPQNGTEVCVRRLGRNRGSIKSFVQKQGIKRYKYRIEWTDDQLKYLKEHYADTPTKEIAKKLKHTLCSVNGMASKLALKKTQDHINKMNARWKKDLAELGKAHRFKKGTIPANKGKKMDPEVYEKTKHTFFPKGHKPKNTLYDGAITTRHRHKRNYSRKYIRISEGVWQELQIYEWEKQYGPVPEGKILTCLTDDSLNCNPTNWKLTDRITHLEKNAGRKELTDKYVARMISRDKEIQSQIIDSPELIALKRAEMKLKRTINEHSN